MIDQQTLEGNWHEIQGKLRSEWGSLTDHDLKELDGNVEQLMGKIQKKTGATRDNIEQFFDQFSTDGGSAVSRASEAVRGYAQEATNAVQETSHQAAASLSDGYAEVEQMVRQRPAGSLAVCFGAGIITGVAVALSLRWRQV